MFTQGKRLGLLLRNKQFRFKKIIIEYKSFYNVINIIIFISMFQNKKYNLSNQVH